MWKEEAHPAMRADEKIGETQQNLSVTKVSDLIGDHSHSPCDFPTPKFRVICSSEHRIRDIRNDLRPLYGVRGSNPDPSDNPGLLFRYGYHNFTLGNSDVIHRAGTCFLKVLN